MKNLKKLFVVLPLLLVMLLSVVPVMAEETFAVKGSYVDDARFQAIVDMTSFTQADYVEYLNQKGNLIPVWVGENIPYANSNFAGVKDDEGNKVNDRHMNVVVMKQGAVHGWVKANYDAVSPLAVAQKYVEDNLTGYQIPTYQIQNVMKLTKLVNVPETWVDLGTEKKPVIEKTEIVDAYTAWTFADNAVLFDADATFTETQLQNAPFSKLAEDKKSVEFNGVNYALTLENDTYKIGKEIIVVKDTPVMDGLTVAPAKDEEPLKSNILYSGANTVPVKRETTKQVVIKETKESEVAIKGDASKLTEAKIEGLLIIVEKNYVDVEITHHFVFPDGTEVTQVENVQWVKGEQGALGKTVPGFTLNEDKTKIEPVYEGDYLVLGEKVVKSYKVDLYYTASEDADKEQVDAAFGTTVNNVANVNNAQQLPATGAADSFALVLSSLAMVVVGLIIKK